MKQLFYKAIFLGLKLFDFSHPCVSVLLKTDCEKATCFLLKSGILISSGQTEIMTSF